MTTDLTMFAPLINPWNGIVAVATLLVIEVIKSAFPQHFGNDNGGNRWLRPMCVLGCGIGYQVDGPWITGEMDPWLRLFVGGLVGAATTIGYAFVRVCVKKIMAQTQEGATKSIKKWAAVLMALAAAVSGIYGAWFKPENRAKDAYKLTAEAIEELSKDVQELHDLVAKGASERTALDKTLSVDMAVLTQRLDDMEKVLERRLAYKPTTGPPVEAMGGGSVEMIEPTVMYSGETTVESDVPSQQKAPQIKRKGLQIQMPAAQELF